MADVLAEVRGLVDDGVVQVTLLGQTVNAWGRREGRSLGELIRALQPLAGLQRLRFITSHPEEMDDALIDAMAASDKCGLFLHLPPQSGSTRLLRRMARGYTAERYREIVAQLRARIPGVQIGADIITGFPGEQDEDHAATRRLMEELRFSQAFIFRYSPRPGTPAWGRLADDVPEDRKHARLLELQALQRDHQLERHRAMVGTVHRVLVEGASRRDPRVLFGRNLAFDRLVFAGPTDRGAEELTGQLVDVEITQATALTLSGRLAGSHETAADITAGDEAPADAALA
jgi:tRNA-2-methylthio-N6-dimethylallyladenosine synthase